MANITLNCPICSQPMKFTGQASYYDRKSKFKTSMYYCKACNIYYRDIENRQIVDHFYAASYVQRENESRFFLARQNFFKFILTVISKFFQSRGMTELSSLTLVDFGSSYGHLLELSKQWGFKAIGIELNEDLIQYCTEKKLIVFRKVDNLPEKVDIFTLIDSLYYLPNPREMLLKINVHLKEEGIVVIRITNRNLYTKLLGKLLYRGNLNILGDSIISYSLKSVKILFNLTGFEVIRVIPDFGQGKKLDSKQKIFYLLTSLLTYLSFKTIILTPGIIIVGERLNLKRDEG